MPKVRSTAEQKDLGANSVGFGLFDLVVSLAVLAAGAGLSLFVAPPNESWLFLIVTVLMWVGGYGFLFSRAEWARSYLARGIPFIVALLVAMGFSVGYWWLHGYCVIRSRDPQFPDPVYFPLFLGGTPGTQVETVFGGNRQDAVTEDRPRAWIQALDREPGMRAARGWTTVLFFGLFEFAFVATAAVFFRLSSAMSSALASRSSASPTEAPLPRKKSKRFRFRVALTFPGEHREQVEEIATLLRRELGGPKRVFYDKWHEGDLARPNSHKLLRDIYLKQSNLVVVFLCADYERKDWCRLEWSRRSPPDRPTKR